MCNWVCDCCGVCFADPVFDSVGTCFCPKCGSKKVVEIDDSEEDV